MAKKNIIKRSDYDRVLITETLPYETPIIFSNDGLYERVKNLPAASEFQRRLTKALVFGEGGTAAKSTEPYLYKVRKNSLEYRRLALLHPASQWKIREFYRQYDRIILHYCAISPASIRAPKSIASTFYSKSSWENIYKYKEGRISSESIDGYAKHTPSYFAYRGYDRLFKFFDSADYFELEKRFDVQMTLDVAKCFDSIYTHSLAWAVKDKEFVKQNIRSSSFGNDFDSVIRHGNHNETNGIPIGPEVSRVFAEIIFQEVDRFAISRLSEGGCKFGIDFVFRRYVDDVYIFARTDSLATKIYATYSDALIQFNLHANSGKMAMQQRPFVSKKTRLILGAGELADSFFDSFLESNGLGKLIPKPIHSPWRLAKGFIDAIKVLCSRNDVAYDEVASFLISALTERIKRLVNEEAAAADEGSKEYFSAIIVLVEVLFFLYSVAPSVSASYKLSTAIILLIRFTRAQIKEYEEEVAHKLYQLILDLLVGECQRQRVVTVDGFVHLEMLNILLAARELGDSYLVPEVIIKDLFVRVDELSYFTVSSCLFYIRDSNEYERIKKILIKFLREKLSDLSDVFIKSEKAHLLLDALGCPYLPLNIRKKWVRAIGRKIGITNFTGEELEKAANELSREYWQVNWSDVDLLNSLEKKELRQAY
ncbi:antiviral reverse transcriptase Drt3b [Variovorax sp. NFACC27]|uniref:antiviral reverse transcriptase Drt3b n=1 Tax=unclassified Variovorax TaxID=663243 RepID=UPI000897EF48|nr:Reverse transcriptase (RNA-dependent DNA polymerase) [Variovorax sp. NFACC28]SEG85987.1 Reverse transcriptase (RNA-dependent DNA polymerase) [Variovorax sp. NFACC29]SFD22548.1 Reverse transcriptase (RNA-dependent DNA polymerase) [Variovorax sp. NFACC26]SFG29373.1 Reverse transcriptase (RNA-dependent DNA polymerase) [Variovorax sp. NFACC27]